MRANTIPVNTTADTGSTGACALRDAITAANTDTAVNACPAGSGTDTITFTVSGTITLGSTLPEITSSGLTIDGSGQSITISGNNDVRVMSVDAGAVLTLKYLTVANGNAGFGGVADPNTEGGGIYNAGGTLTVTNCTFSGNRAAVGGGIDGYGTFAVVNSTFSGNSASTQGGGINNGAPSTLSITNSTFSGTSAPSGSGGGILNYSALNLANTILANNTGGDCALASSPFGLGTLNASGMNLVKDGSCGASSDPSNFIVADPMLGPLANNGGPTMSMALLTGSPAIDTADDAICAAPPVNNIDQRGEPRSVDGNAISARMNMRALLPSHRTRLRN